MVSVISKSRTITNGQAVDATTPESNFVELYQNTQTLATALTAIESGTATISSTLTMTGSVAFTGTVNVGLSSDPATPADGMVWYNTTTDKFKVRKNGTSEEVATTDNKLGTLGLTGGVPTRTSASVITLTAGLCRSDDDTVDISIPAGDLTMPTDLDTGSEADDTWYYIWVCSGSSGTKALFSASSSSPTLPSGYDTYKRRLRVAVRNDSSGDFLDFYMPRWGEVCYRGDTTSGSDYTNILALGTNTSATDVDASGLVPPTSTHISLRWTGNGTNTNKVLTKGGGKILSYPLTANSQWYASSVTIETDSSQTIQYQSGSGSNSSLWVESFIISENE